jgi:uncharacterized protein (TIGR02996 family)
MTMPEEYDRLLGAVLREPDDPAPSLILADWLFDHGRLEEAAFIRRTPPGPECRRRDREAYQRELRAFCYPFLPASQPVYRTTHWLDGQGQLQEGPIIEQTLAEGIGWYAGRRDQFVDVRNGFVIALATHWRQFAKYAAAWFRHNPIRHVYFFDHTWPSDMLRHPDRDPFNWSYWRSWWQGTRDALPLLLWERLSGYTVEMPSPYRDHVLHRCYPDKAAALLALSRSAVAYGRDQAGLELPVTGNLADELPQGA